MDELIERLRRLPKQPRTCQGGVFGWMVGLVGAILAVVEYFNRHAIGF